MVINQEAFAGGYFDVAYHALAGALNWAEERNDMAALSKLEQIAEDQLRFIDQHAPVYHHSSRSASSRGHVSIFATLKQQAHARLVVMQHKHENPAIRSQSGTSTPDAGTAEE